MKRGAVLAMGSGYYHWRPNTKSVYSTSRSVINTRKTNNTKEILGFVNPIFVMIIFIAMAGAFYLYTINNGASKGMKVRVVEKEITELKKNNEQLKIKEAELKSLYHAEEMSKNLKMKIMQNANYIEETGPMALK
jgi:DNA integrity scanning protein DisA with diadenylate cyclase activity